ncbi:MAG: hypothetical protein DMF74_01465 [Acidobacteria bacterium]|nr:MAG: hypothetical protein DMF74_01465 [Acidobacteriota bacterium]
MKAFIPAALILQLSAVGCHLQSQRTTYASPDSAPFRAMHLPVGTHPSMLSIADANRDGNVDILVANGGSANVSVYLGDGKGGFSQSNGSPYSAGQNPTDIATGDFNGDGNLDIAIANHGVKLVTVLLGNGKGQFSFAPGSPFSVASNPHPHGIAVADFNGDKKPDIAIDSWAENKMLVIFGKGDGTFQTPGVKFDVGKMPYQRLRTADVNEDGYADIVTSNFEGSSVSLLLADGHGNSRAKIFRCRRILSESPSRILTAIAISTLASFIIQVTPQIEARMVCPYFLVMAMEISLSRKARRFRLVSIRRRSRRAISTETVSQTSWSRIMKTER